MWAVACFALCSPALLACEGLLRRWLHHRTVCVGDLAWVLSHGEPVLVRLVAEGEAAVFAGIASVLLEVPAELAYPDPKTLGTLDLPCWERIGGLETLRQLVVKGV